jgi:hypothetical protein
MLGQVIVEDAAVGISYASMGGDGVGFGPDRFVVQKGFSRGLMDLEGNWVYEESVFSSLED